MNNSFDLPNTTASPIARSLVYYLSIGAVIIMSLTSYLWLPHLSRHFKSTDQNLILQTQQAVYEHEQRLVDLSQKVTQLINYKAQENLISKKQLLSFENFLILKLHILNGSNYEYQLKKIFDNYHIESNQFPTLLNYASSGIVSLRTIDTVFGQEANMYQSQQSKWHMFKNWLKSFIKVKSNQTAVDQPALNILTLIKSEQYSSAITLIQSTYPQRHEDFKESLKRLDDAIHLNLELEQLRHHILTQQ